jgi:L-amino acid N-acyltransferase YncA
VENLTIREARPEDSAAIVSILNPIIETGTFTAFDTPITVEEERNYIMSLPASGIFLVAVREVDRQILGFQSMEPFATYTHAFDHVGIVGTYVAPEVRRQGVAKRLFEAMFAAALRKHYEKIFTYVRADNPTALSTYLHHGFRIVGKAERQAKIKGRYIDEIIIEKLLASE